jgi:colanic acid/amylovoran biosynthesis glycosyltransferase
MKSSQSKQPVCAHYVSSYLPLTENWIYRVLINRQRVKPIMLSRKKENLKLFPLENIFSLSDLNVIRRYAEILFFRVTGYFNFFKQVCLQNKVDILHVHFGYHGVKFQGLKQTLKIPLVCSFYGDDAFSYPQRKGYAKKYLSLFNTADRILVLGPYMKSELMKLGCPEDKLVIQHLGIDSSKIEFKKREVKPNEPIRFLFASSFLEKKGIVLAIKALASFKDKIDFTVDIIGDGPLRKQIESEIEIGGIQDRVTLHGYRPYDFVIEMAYQCQVFIQASLTGSQNNKEGTPMAIVDAMATGMAVISTRHSDIPEIVKDGVSGYLANENDVENLKECIQKIIDAPELVSEFSKNARTWIEQEFDAAKQTQKLEQLYISLMNRVK